MTRYRLLRSSLPVAIILALVAWLPACGDDGGGAEGDGDESGDMGDDDDDDDVGDDDDDDTGDGEVSIYRDAHGVPHIVADTDEGAMYGLGYASAEDRLLQMTIWALAAQGRLAEFFGGDYFQQDRRFRLMGHWRHAQRAADNLDAEHAALLQAYADGVNAWIANNPDAINPQFEALGVEVPTWTPAHSLAVWYRVADLFTNDPTDKAQALLDFEAEVAAVGLQQAIDNATADTHPGDPGAAVVQASDVPQDVQDGIAAYAAKMGYGPMSQAPHDYGHITPKFSHAWVVGGDRTTTGESVLVSDPQVAVTSPNFLYEWAVVGDEIHARGASAAGVPGLLIGYTPSVAWGLTAAGIDSRDLFRLEMTDATHYTVDGEAHELVEETETIEVAGQMGRDVTYTESVWGPVISDLVEGAPGEWAMKGVPFSAGEREPFVALVGMLRAQSIDDLRTAIESWSTPSANMVAAGPNGDIFYTLLGDIPLRSPASPLGGMIAQDGSSTSYDWVDVIPNEYKPWILNPADGMILSANHRPVAEWYPLPLGVGQGGGGETLRSRRLRELLEALPGTVEPRDVVDDVQWDCVNSAKRDLVALAAHVEALQPGRLSAETLNVIDALDAWLAAGGTMETDTPGIGLANAIGVKFRIQQTGPVLNAQYGGGQTGLSLFLDDMMAQINADPMFMPSDEAIAYVNTELTNAWDSAISDAAYAAGPATPTMQYMVGFDLQAPVSSIDVTAPTLACADGNTIWSQRGETYTQYVDLSAIDESQTILAPGNHEGPEGELWTSQLDPWAEGTLKPTALTEAAIEALGEPVTLDVP